MRTRIMGAFTVLLLFSFLMTGLIFNIAVNQYIESNAISQLESADIMLQAMEQRQEGMPQPINPAPGRVNNFRIRANMFPVDGYGNIPADMEVSDEVAEIMQALGAARLDDVSNKRIRADSGIYYVSAYYLANSLMGENAYWIVYADVTGLSFFASTINIFLLVLVCIMFAMTVIVTIFLSNSITHPIKKLSALATGIGKGDFTPSDFMFRDAEFANLNMALNKSAKQLGVYDSNQKAFFQNVSHELRTPLMSIKCYAEGISVGIMAPKEASDTILQETDKLTKMVMDLLYISKVDNITSIYTKARIDVREIVRACAHQQSAIAETKQVGFSFDFDESPVYCDCVGELMKRAVDNLISNAIRYAASRITLSCHEAAGKVAIGVSDDGAGIEAAIMPHIFERFFKGAGGDHGIGLSLVKTIVEQHGGAVAADNSANGGAAFTMTLPGAAPGSATLPGPASPASRT